jgi:hypothetical protein
MAEPDPFAPPRVFAALDARSVDYVVIGHVRMTNDLDLVPKPTRANLERLADALNDLDARVLNTGNEGISIDANMLARAALWQFATSAGLVDVLHEPPGQIAYDKLRKAAVEIPLRDLVIPFAGREDLIRMKRAAGRPRDLSDVAALTEHDEAR